MSGEGKAETASSPSSQAIAPSSAEHAETASPAPARGIRKLRKSSSGGEEDEASPRAPRGASSASLNSATRSNGVSGSVEGTPKKMRFASDLILQHQLHFGESDGDKSSNREGSSEDGASGSPSDECEARTRLLGKIETAKQKLAQINIERENELEEFLSMTKKVEAARGCDNPQMARIRQHYEKKNKRHTQNTDTLRRKIETYEARLAELEAGGSGSGLDTSSRSAQMINTVGQGIRRTGANLKEMTGTVMAAPFELAHKIKMNTFGSADNLPGDASADGAMIGQSLFYDSSQSARSSDSPQPGNGKPKSSTLPPGLRMPMAPSSSSSAMSSLPQSSSQAQPPHAAPQTAEIAFSLQPEVNPLQGNKHPEREQERRPASSSSGLREAVPKLQLLDDRPPLLTPAHFTEETLRQILGELKQLKKTNATVVQHMDKLQERVADELARYDQILMEERFKCQRLEKLLNDWTELQGAEVASLRKELQVTASRLDYQYNDRLNRFDDKLEDTQHQMLRVEKSLRESLDLRDGGNWYNALLLSGATILVELLKIIFYLTAAVLDLVRPVTGSRYRVAVLVVLIALTVLLFQHIDLSSLPGRVLSSPSPDPPAVPSNDTSAAPSPP